MSIEQHKKKCRANFAKAFGDSICIITQMEPDKKKKYVVTVRHLIIHNWFKIWPLPEEGDDKEKLQIVHAELKVCLKLNSHCYCILTSTMVQRATATVHLAAIFKAAAV